MLNNWLGKFFETERTKMVQRARLTPKLSIKTHEEGDKLKDIERILSALSNEDALKIFKMARA